MPQPPTPCDELSFEQALERLELIVRKLEEGQLGLTDSLAAYEAGVKHLKQCYEALETAQRKIELLTGIDAAGNAVTRPFDDEATKFEPSSPPSPSPNSARRRPGKPEKPPAPPVAKDIDDSPGLF